MMHNANVEVSEEKKDKVLKGILENCLRIADIVSDLKGYAKLASDDTNKSTDIFTLVKNALSIVNEKAKGNNIELSSYVPEGEFFAKCVQAQVIQSISDILTNALEAASKSEERKVSISVESDDQYQIIKIKDSGPGVPAAIRHKIFQPFFTTKDVGSGKGLGLSTSLKTIENNGGKLVLENESKETTFLIMLLKDEEEKQVLESA